MATLQEANAQRWQNCHVPADKGPAFSKVADRIKANKAIYQEIEKETNVPWWFIGILHNREASLDMNANLAQGDPWNKKSIHVPAGRGPFSSFKEAAIDALTNCSPYAAKNKDWSIGGALAMFEKYNGLGYFNKGVPSPYVWAGTDQYVRGKYVRDGVYDPNYVDQQLGCAGLMKFLGVGAQPASSGPVVAGGIAAGTVAAASTAPTHLLPYIIGGGFALALIAFLVFDVMSYNKWKKQNAMA